MRIQIAFLSSFLGLAACGTVFEKSERVLEGTRPDRPSESVPARPGSMPASLPPRVIVVVAHGLGADLVDRGMREGWLPHFRRLRTEGTLTRLELGPRERFAADAAFFTGSAGATGGEPRVSFVARPRDESLALLLPAGLPRVAAAFDATTFVSSLAAGGVRCVVLGAAAGFDGEERANVSILPWGCLTDVSFGAAGATFAIEGARRSSSPGNVEVVEVEPSTRGERFDTFFVDVRGPMTAGGDSTPTTPAAFPGPPAPSTSRLEVRATKDRSRAEVVTSDDRAEVRAGRWSEPLALRFAIAPGVDVLGRSRVYLRPTGEPRLEFYVEPPDFNPRRGHPWQPLSVPTGFAAALAEVYGDLPRFGSSFPDAAFAAGLLGARDVSTCVASAFERERAVFEGELARSDADLLVLSTSFLLDVERIGPGRGEEVDFFGRRIARDRIEEAAAGVIDEVLGSALTVAEDPNAPLTTDVLFLSGFGSSGAGLFGATRRLARDAGVPSIEDVTATVVQQLGHAALAAASGTPLPLGPRMEPAPVAGLKRIERAEERMGGDAAPGAARELHR